MGLAIHRWAPDPRLAADVVALFGYEEVTIAPMRRRELPGTLVVLIFDLGPTLRFLDESGDLRAMHADGFTAGLGMAPVFMETVGRQSGLEVLLTPEGAGRLLGLPVAALGGAVVGLDALRCCGGAALTARLREARGWPRRFALLQAWLLERAAAARDVAPDLAACWSLLRRSQGTLPIAALADCMGWSARHLSRRFTDEYGLTLKQAARLTRFERAVGLIRTGEALAQVALDCGYADQSHLANEVTALAGLPPAALRRAMLPDEGAIAH